MYNRTFDVFDASDDYTGMIGVTVGDGNNAFRAYDTQEGRARWFNDDGRLNHVYVNTNEDGKYTVASGGNYGGIGYGEKDWYNRIHTKHYLLIKLTNDRKYNF